MKTILVPLGNSNKAICTLQYAVDYASVCNAKIYVIQGLWLGQMPLMP